MQPLVLQVKADDRWKRNHEPLTCGIPFPRGVLKDAASLELLQEHSSLPLQSNILDTWPDGSIRWLLLDWQASYQGNSNFLLQNNTTPAKASQQSLSISAATNRFTINNGVGVFTISTQPGDHLLSFRSEEHSEELSCASLHVTDSQGRIYQPLIQCIEKELTGSLRTVIKLHGHLIDSTSSTLCDLLIRFHFYTGHNTLRAEITLRNTRKAEHPGGLWDLGNGGAIYLRDANLRIVSLAKSGQWKGTIIPEYGIAHTFSDQVKLHQESSGGENWNSRNHVNRHNKVPLRFRGYELKYDSTTTQGLRATPTLMLRSEEQQLGIAVPGFWQKFPQALTAQTGEITYHFFPPQAEDFVELQGGEQSTHECFLLFGQDTVTETPLHWCHSPGFSGASPAWYAHSQIVPGLTPRIDDPHTEYLKLVDAALEGSDTLQTKREAIDEYGWRHFGDIYGDHEAVFHKGPTALISHYNNQYDAIAGLGYQYLRSADARWLREMHYLANHVIDIDIYHTDEDKSAYNHGLFWHTYHYVDAHTGTHRSYPRNARVPPHGTPVPGGGPANEQNYTTGLMLHYFLTGQKASRDAAMELAQWVIDMDDGNKTIFRWLSRADTGLASKSRTPEYHGPGRGAANSISALLDGHRLSRSQQFLDKAEQLIRRCIHPDDNVEKHQLLDAENRWFYTMFLQSLGKYLLYKQELNQLDMMYAYARASLLHYVRWMAEHEYPYLEKPEILEYPTETWAAQDMRKCEIFNLASLYTQDASEKALFRTKAEYFFQYSTATLAKMPTRTLCRPVVLMLNFGFTHHWYRSNPDASAIVPTGDYDFGKPVHFVPQKALALKRAKALVAAAGVLFALLLLLVCYWLLG